MTVIRTNYKVPLSVIGEYFPPGYDLSNPKYWLCLDMYKDDSIPDSNFPNGRPCIIMMVGGGVQGRVEPTASAVTRFTSRGWIVAYPLYHHPRNTDPLATPMGAWTHYTTPGEYNYALYVMNLREVYNLHMGLKYILDNLASTYQIDTRDGKGIFISGKSMGGAAAVEYSFLSSLNTFETAKYGKKIAAIFNNCGIKGQGSNGGWRDPDRVLHILCRGVTMAQHPMIHTYNDGDVTGDYDIYQRLRLAITPEQMKNQYFVNFTDLAHDTENTFVESCIDNFLAGTVNGTSMNCFYMQGTVKTAIAVKSELQELLDAKRDQFKNVLATRNVPVFTNLTPISTRASIGYMIDTREAVDYTWKIGNVRYSKNPYGVIQAASLTKLLTILTCESAGINVMSSARIVRQSYMSDEGSGANINVGEYVTMLGLTANMMLPSSNVSAVMMAYYAGATLLAGDGVSNPTDDQKMARFVTEMNKKAAALGMTDSTFTTPTGLGSNPTTAVDIAKLVLATLSSSAVLTFMQQKTYSITAYAAATGSAGRTFVVESTNKLLGTATVLGGKTGTLGSVYNVVEVAQGTRTINGKSVAYISLAINLGAATADDRFTDAMSLLKRMGDTWQAAPA